MSDDSKDPLFYYSSQRRQNRSSNTHYTPDDSQRRPTVQKSNVAVRANVMIFICLFLIVVMFLISRRAGNNPGFEFGGNTLVISIIEEGNEKILSIIKTAPASGEVYLGAVNLTISPASGNFKAISEQIEFRAAAVQDFSIILPFAENDLFVTFSSPAEERTFRINANR